MSWEGTKIKKIIIFVTVVNLQSSSVVVSCSCASYMSLITDNQFKMNIASLNRVEKNLRDVFFDIPIKVSNIW